MLDHFLKYPIDDLPTFLTLVPLLALWYRLDYKKRIERYFFIYLCFKLAIELVMFYMASKGQNNLFLYNSLILISYCLISKMFYEVIEHKIAKWMIIAGSLAFIAVFAYDVWIVGMNEVVIFSCTFECFLLVGYCLMFFAWLSISLKVPNLFEWPVFWIVAGIFCYYSATTFTTPILNMVERFGPKNELYDVVVVGYLMESMYLTGVGLGILIEK